MDLYATATALCDTLPKEAGRREYWSRAELAPRWASDHPLVITRLLQCPGFTDPPFPPMK
jgi:hypothetical protein